MKRFSLLMLIGIGIWLWLTLLPKTAGMCLASAPYAPAPVDQAEIITAHVELHWQVDCAVKVEVRMNGALVATLDGATTTYSIEAQTGVNTWQVIAIDEAGNRAESPVWRFRWDVDSWLATPQPVATAALIYTPPAPPRILIDVNSPSMLVTLLCGSLCSGLGLVIVAAWLLGVRAQRRDHERRWYRF